MNDNYEDDMMSYYVMICNEGKWLLLKEWRSGKYEEMTMNLFI